MIMRSLVRPHVFSGTVRVPASKSHTIRRLLMASLAEGVSSIDRPLDSLDARSCVDACRAFGAEIDEIRSPDGKAVSCWKVRGVGAGSAGGSMRVPDSIVDVGNSGTTLYLALAIAALGEGYTVFSGDAQIRRRSADSLLTALRGLGATAFSTRGNGCAPLVVGGPWKGGRVSLECPTSQYLSAILIAAPLAPQGSVTEIDVPLLNERPYIEMTLSYLDRQGIPYEATSDRSWFRIRGGAKYTSVDGSVAGDFSSAAFPACAAIISGGSVDLLGLDPEDTQGDKALFSMLTKMGCELQWTKSGGEHRLSLRRGARFEGAEFDLNDTPDALPALAACACYAQGETRLVNVANARIKETDRISTMDKELRKLGARIEECPDGLVIRGGPLSGGTVNGHEDHRVVMALAIAALGASGPVEIEGTQAAAVTYPGFLDLLEAGEIL